MACHALISDAFWHACLRSASDQDQVRKCSCPDSSVRAPVLIRSSMHRNGREHSMVTGGVLCERSEMQINLARLLKEKEKEAK